MSAPITFEVDIDGQIGSGQMRVASTRPAGLDQHLSDTEWTSFCNKFNQALYAGNEARDAASCLIGICVLAFAGSMIGLIISTVSINNDATDPACVDGWNDGYSYTETNGYGTTYITGSPCTDSKQDNAGRVVSIVFMVLALLLGCCASSALHNQSEASLQACRRVCEEFSNSKTNMSVRLRTRSTGAVYHHHNGDHQTPSIGAIYYIEFQFSLVGYTPAVVTVPTSVSLQSLSSRPPAFAPSSANGTIPTATEVDVEVGATDAFVVPCTSSSVAMIPVVEAAPAYATVPIAGATPVRDETSATQKASLTTMERLRVLESIKSQLTEDEYKEKRKEILSEL